MSDSGLNRGPSQALHSFPNLPASHHPTKMSQTDLEKKRSKAEDAEIPVAKRTKVEPVDEGDKQFNEFYNQAVPDGSVYIDDLWQDARGLYYALYLDSNKGQFWLVKLNTETSEAERVHVELCDFTRLSSNRLCMASYKFTAPERLEERVGAVLVVGQDLSDPDNRELAFRFRFPSEFSSDDRDRSNFAVAYLDELDDYPSDSDDE